MHGTGSSSTKTLNINRECESMSAKKIDVTDSPDSANTILKHLRLANVNRLRCAQLNINSIRNKFESLKEIVSTNVDILWYFLKPGTSQNDPKRYKTTRNQPKRPPQNCETTRNDPKF